MSALSLTVTGSVVLKPSQDHTAGGSSGTCTYPVGIQSDVMGPTADDGQQRRSIASPALFVDLGVPSNFLGRFLHFRIAAGDGGPVDLRITFATAGAVTNRVAGLFQIEAPAGDEITKVEVQGAATFAWLLTGSTT